MGCDARCHVGIRHAGSLARVRERTRLRRVEHGLVSQEELRQRLAAVLLVHGVAIVLNPQIHGSSPSTLRSSSVILDEPASDARVSNFLAFAAMRWLMTSKGALASVSESSSATTRNCGGLRSGVPSRTIAWPFTRIAHHHAGKVTAPDWVMRIIGRFTGCPSRRHHEGSARTGEGAAVPSKTSGWNGRSYAACTDRRRGASSCSASCSRRFASRPSGRSDRDGRPPDECTKLFTHRF